MAVRWYYKVLGQEAGPVSAPELKELAASGFLTPDVLLRKGDEGAWFPSGDVRGLYEDVSREGADESPEGSAAPKQAPAGGSGGREVESPSKPSASEPQPAADGWYCQVMGKEIGPLSPSALRELAASGFIAPGVPVRKGIHADWVPSDRVKGLFAEAPKAAARKKAEPPAAPPEPDEKPAPVEPRRGPPEKAPAKPPPSGPQSSGVSWYYEVMGEETGPLSAAQLRELAESGFVTSDVLVRKGADGRWVPAEEVEGLLQKADKSDAADLSPDAAAALPPIPKPPPAPIACAPPAETPRDAADKASPKPAPVRAQTTDAAWYYEAMGQETGPLSSAALKELADSGLLTPDTRVRMGAAGAWVVARQVKGLFERRSAAAVSKRAKRPAAAEGGPAPAVPKPAAKPAPRPAPKPAPEALPEFALEPLPQSALDPLPSTAAAGPASLGGMGDLLDEALSAPIPVSTGPALPAAPRAHKPARKPRHVASSPFGGGSGRPRKRRGPGMVSRTLIGGLMVLGGTTGLVVSAILILVFSLGLIGAGMGAFGALPVASAARGVFVLLVNLAMNVVALVGSYYILSGGAGIMRGQSAGADKGAMGYTIAITLQVFTILFQVVMVNMASGQGAAQAAAVQRELEVIVVLACIRIPIHGALLWWCKTAGQRLPH